MCASHVVGSSGDTARWCISKRVPPAATLRPWSNRMFSWTAFERRSSKYIDPRWTVPDRATAWTRPQGPFRHRGAAGRERGPSPTPPADRQPHTRAARPTYRGPKPSGQPALKAQSRRSLQLSSEPLAHHIQARKPQCLCPLGVERITAHPCELAAGSSFTLATWQSSAYSPPTSPAGATKAAQMGVAAPCATVFHANADAADG